MNPSQLADTVIEKMFPDLARNDFTWVTQNKAADRGRMVVHVERINSALDPVPKVTDYKTVRLNLDSRVKQEAMLENTDSALTISDATIARLTEEHHERALRYVRDRMYNSDLPIIPEEFRFELASALGRTTLNNPGSFDVSYIGAKALRAVKDDVAFVGVQCAPNDDAVRFLLLTWSDVAPYLNVFGAGERNPMTAGWCGVTLSPKEATVAQ
jgi:hypothetical protein